MNSPSPCSSLKRRLASRILSATWVLALTAAALGQAGGAEEREGGPQERARYWRERQGSIPAERIVDAVERASRLAPASLPTLGEGSQESDRALPPGAAAWQSIGPSPIRDRSSVPPRTFSGRVSTLAVHPTNPQIVYAGAANGGVWKSNDGGASWSPMPGEEARPVLAMGSIAIDPVNPNVVYAGTGEPNGGTSTGGRGIYKTVDGGATWTLLGSGSPFPIGGKVYRLVVGPDSRVWAATPQGLLRSADGGATWKVIGNGLPKNVEVWDFALSADASVHFAVVRGRGLFRLRTSDASWLQVTTGLPAGTAPWNQRARIAVAPSSPQTAFVILDVGGRISGFVTGNRGTSWTAADSLLGSFTVSTQGGYNMEVAIDPRSPSIVYVGGIELAVTTNGTAGGPWLPVTPKTHVDQHALAFPPCTAAPCPLFVGNDGGVYHLTPTNPFDFGIVTAADRNDTLRITELVGGDLGINFTAEPIALGGAQDNGTMRWWQFDPANQTPFEWSHNLGADGGFSYLSHQPTDRERAYAETQPPPSGGVGLHQSIDQGRSFVAFNQGLPISQAAFYPLYTLDRSDPQHLVAAAANAVYEIVAPQASWYLASPDFGERPTALAVATSAGNVVYAGFCSGRVFRTENAYRDGQVAAYAERSSGLPVGVCGGGAMAINAIAVDRSDPDRAYLAGSTPGAAAQVVFGTSNGGMTWTNLSGNLPAGLPAGLPAYSLVTYPAGATRVLVVGTEAGAYFSTTEGASWAKLTSGLPNTRIAQLALDRDLTTLAAFTGGRGAFVTSIGGPLCSYSLSLAGASFDVGGGAGSFTVSAASGCSWNATPTVPWVNVTAGASGDGTGTVSYAVQPNGGGFRSGAVTVEDQVFAINQAGTSCSYSLSRTSAVFPASGGSGLVGVTADAGCGWTAVSNESWIHVTGGSPGSGSGTLSYFVDANSATVLRSGTLTIAGQTLTVFQDPASSGSCVVTAIDWTSRTFPRQGGSAFDGFTVSPASCAWSVTVTDDWIHVSELSGTGSGALFVTVDGNNGNGPRSGTFTINGTVVQVHQGS